MRAPRAVMTAPLVIGGNVYHNALHGLHGFAVLHVGEDLGGLTCSSYPSRRMVSMRMERCISPRPITRKESLVAESLDLEGHILEQLTLQPVADLAAGDKLALAPGEGAVVYRKGHLDGRVVDLEEGQGA